MRCIPDKDTELWAGKQARPGNLWIEWPDKPGMPRVTVDNDRALYEMLSAMEPAERLAVLVHKDWNTDDGGYVFSVLNVYFDEPADGMTVIAP